MHWSILYHIWFGLQPQSFCVIILGSWNTSFKLESNYGSPMLLIVLIFYPLTSLFVSVYYRFSRKVTPCFFPIPILHCLENSIGPLSTLRAQEILAAFFSNCYSIVLIFLYLIFRFRLFLTNLLSWWPNMWKPVWIIKKIFTYMVQPFPGKLQRNKIYKINQFHISSKIIAVIWKSLQGLHVTVKPMFMTQNVGYM